MTTKERCEANHDGHADWRCKFPKGHEGPHYAEKGNGYMRWPVYANSEPLLLQRIEHLGY